MSHNLFIENIGILFTPVIDGDNTTIKAVKDAAIYIRDGVIEFAGSTCDELTVFLGSLYYSKIDLNIL